MAHFFEARMNRMEIVSLIVMLVTSIALHFAGRALMPRLRPILKPWLDPIISQYFPSLKMDEWLFEPIEGADIPPKQREFFNSHTPAFLARHYTHLGDIVLRRDREPSCNRLFLSPDRTVLGSVSSYLGTHVITGMSVLMDGTYLETSSLYIPSPPPKEHGLRFFSCRTNSPLELLDHHAMCMAKVTAETGSSPTVLEPGDFKAVMNYGRQLSLNSLKKQGVLGELPEFLQKKQETAGAH
jgi:hypothetical protein